MSNLARFLTLPLAVAALILAAMPGCSDDVGVSPNEGGGSSGKSDGGSSGGNDTICLLNNCDTDRDCADCSEGATTCLQKEHRCVACGEGTNGKNCGSGKTCSQYGSCVTNGTVCTEDANHVPTITCKNTADCGACGPKFRVCDTGSGKCVGCSDANTVNCQSTDTCISGTCTAKCPAACDSDAQCGNCGGPAAPAHACNKHICAECSATVPCTGGKTCDTEHGKCIATCGVTGDHPGVSSCSEDGNCGACTATTKCKLPTPHTDGVPDGTCAVPANGCSDIGKGIIVLPAPFNKFTNTCSNDGDCAGQGTDINVGKLLSDATGLNLKDGTISYSMHACASVEVLDKSCGVCVPCKVDTDCSDIDVSKAAGDIFGPIGSVAASLLLDKAFGPNDHKIHMYCQNVAGDYGVCLPCGDILHRCAQTADDVPAQGSCNHDVCEKGEALGRQCGDCQAKVCAKDPYCCTKEWDAACLTDVDQYCTDKTCTPNSCAFRSPGWYCNSPGTIEGGYKCLGDGKDPSGTTADGYQCDTGKCTLEDPNNIKSHAVLCDTETAGDATCPTSSKGKPKCVQ